MMEQIRTVAWKEWKALGDQAGIRGGGGIVVLTLIALIMGAFMPWTAGPEFFTSPLTLFVYPFIGASVAANPVIDSFAGEKERRTLETLLSSPLEDRAILLGKMWVALAAGWTIPMLLYGIALVTVNIKMWGNGIVFPPAWAAVGVPSMSAAAVGLVCSAGILASMHCSTVRQAGQIFGYVVFVVFLAPVIVVALLPDAFKATIGEWLMRQDPMTLVFVGVGALVAVDAICMRLAFTSFRRGRLATE